MNILFFTDGGYGVSPFLCDQLLSINKEYSNIYAVIGATEQQPNLIEKLRSHGITMLRLTGLQSHTDFKNDSKLLKQFIIEKDISIVHIQTNWELALLQYSILGLKKTPKVIFTVHHFRNNENWVKMQFARIIMGIALLLFSDKVIATCNYIRDNFKIVKHKVVKMPLGVDDNYIEHEYKKVDGSPKIIFPAIFREGKRQDLLIRAFAMYLSKEKDVEAKLILPGNGSFLPDSKELAKKLGIESQVVFPGLISKEDLLALYDEVNILACSSISETYCQAIVEGLCLGKCLISTPVGIAPEIIDKDNTSGFLINNEEEIVEKLLFLKHNPQVLLDICKHNYEKRNNYVWKTIAESYLKVARSL